MRSNIFGSNLWGPVLSLSKEIEGKPFDKHLLRHSVIYQPPPQVFRPTVTSTVTATHTTRTVTEHASCYSAAAAQMSDCALSRRVSRRFGLVEERPILDVAGYRVPLVLRPSKVRQKSYLVCTITMS